MAQLILTHSSQFHRALRTRSEFPLSLKVGKFFLFFSMTLMIGVLSFFYLVKSTEVHTRGYEVEKLDIERAKLLRARENKSTEIAQFKSLATIRTSDVVAHMIPARDPVYITKDGNIAQLPNLAVGRP